MVRLFYRKLKENDCCQADSPSLGKTEYKQQHKTAYELLYAALCFCGYELKDYSVEKTEKGKPYIKDRPDINISIAHSGEYCIVAVSDTPCGVDIENKGRISKRISERFLLDIPGDSDIVKWTNRESYGKLIGEGFFFKGEISDGVEFKNFQIDSYMVSVCLSRGEAVLLKRL